MVTLAGTYSDLQGQAVQLQRRLAVGREAEVFALDEDDSRVAKIYKRPEGREQKFRAMINNTPPDATLYCRHSFVCWPETLVLDTGGSFAGFIMPRINFPANRPLRLFCDLISRKRISSRITWP